MDKNVFCETEVFLRDKYWNSLLLMKTVLFPETFQARKNSVYVLVFVTFSFRV